MSYAERLGPSNERDLAIMLGEVSHLKRENPIIRLLKMGDTIIRQAFVKTESDGETEAFARYTMPTSRTKTD